MAGTVVWEVAKVAARVAWWSALFPMFSIPGLLGVYLAYSYGYPAGIAVTATGGALLLAWRALWPPSFQRFVTARLRARWRAWTTYRRHWAQTCALHGLTAMLDDQVLVPKLAKMRIGANVDLVDVQILPGQSLALWRERTAALAHALGARDVQVRTVRPGRIQLIVRRHDALTDAVKLPTPTVPVDLQAVPVGINEDRMPWRLAALGRSILIAAATGGGKSNLLWALFAGLGPAIRDGLVQVWMIDPKGGLEFSAGRPLFTRFVYSDPQEMLALLRDAVWLMQDRAQRLRGVTRLHRPTVAEPLTLVVIDEIATLTAYGVDRKLRADIEQALGMLLSQGRACGVSVIAACQDPSKEVLSMRQLFPTRIALRLSEASQVPMVLGPGARDAGAACEEIPDSTPGVGYVAEDGHAGVQRVRTYQVTDADIRHLIATYAPSQPSTAASDSAA
jgi:S-DNA-T family DNA segregation ATPase FtsK/SpoIIIE